MAAEMKVTMPAVVAALQAYDAAYWGNEAPSESAIRAALEAGLAAMLEPVGVLSPLGAERVTDGEPAAIFPMNKELDDDITIYRIKP